MSQLRTVTKNWYLMVTFSLGPKSIAVVHLIGNATTILKRTIQIIRLRVLQLVMNLSLVDKIQCNITTQTVTMFTIHQQRRKNKRCTWLKKLSRQSLNLPSLYKESRINNRYIKIITRAILATLYYSRMV